MSRRAPIPFRSHARTGRVRSGLEEVLARPGRLRGLRVGLIANPTTVTADLVPASLALKESRGVKLVALFGPEHGIWADAQDLVEVEDSRDPATGLPVYSLYGKTRIPTAEMLSGVDALVFDVQDVGSRYYTFIYTMLYALEACARHGRRLVVLDRPNPLGGAALEGNVLEPEYLSFVGLHPLPPRHGMTVGELALMFQRERGLDAELSVVRMRGWHREMHHAALRAGGGDRGSIRGASPATWTRSACPGSASDPPTSRRRSRSTPAGHAEACRCTSPTAGASLPT